MRLSCHSAVSPRSTEQLARLTLPGISHTILTLLSLSWGRA